MLALCFIHFLVPPFIVIPTVDILLFVLVSWMIGTQSSPNENSSN